VSDNFKRLFLAGLLAITVLFLIYYMQKPDYNNYYDYPIKEDTGERYG